MEIFTSSETMWDNHCKNSLNRTIQGLNLVFILKPLNHLPKLWEKKANIMRDQKQQEKSAIFVSEVAFFVGNPVTIKNH